MTQAHDLPESSALLLARLDELQRAERRATSARMVSVAGHLAGTPLNVIAGRAALIRANPSPQAIEEHARRIEEQVERLALRMRRLVDCFGLDEPSAEHRTVAEVLGECQALYLPVASVKGVSLLIEPREVAPLRIEAELSALILTALLSLGVRTTAAGESITLVAFRLAPRSVVFELNLTGLEVPQHFDRFEPPEQPSHNDPNTLETLWTCLGLARRMGGKLSLTEGRSSRGVTLRLECNHA